VDLLFSLFYPCLIYVDPDVGNQLDHVACTFIEVDVIK